jgi:dolichol kinase
MDIKEKRLIFSNRKNGFNLSYFINKYGDRKLRIVDGLSRKLLHISSGIWQLLFINLVVRDTTLSLKISLLNSLLLILLSTISYSSNKIFHLAGIMYGATSRIRDGIDGRKNSFIARLCFIHLLPIFLIEYIAKQNVGDDENLIFFSFFIFLPLTVGDALGEIIGTIWGKQKIQVWGIGEINRKSVLGTVSVFLGSLVALLLIVISKKLSFEWWLLAFVVSATTTIIELFAPRSTDNFFIPVVNALVCLIFIVFHIHSYS